MTKIWPLWAASKDLQSNWFFSSGRISWVKNKKLETVVALENAQRIIDLKAAGKYTEDIKGLKKGMEALGFDPDTDATNHIQREFVAPAGVEREEW